MGFLKKLFGEGNQPERQSIEINLNDLMAQATQAMQQMNAPQPARAEFIKKTQCHLCGAAKALPPKSAYVYCDFCGGLTDYDFQIACKNPSAAMPGPAYEQLLRSLQSDMAASLQTNNQERYREIQRSLFSKWVELCPNACSPRVNDPAYREQFVNYMAEMQVVCNFDEKYKAYAQTVQEQTVALKWTATFPKPLVSSETFWPLYQTVREQVDYSFEIVRSLGVVDMHPDSAPESLQKEMTWSMFAQGWLPCLSPEDSEKLLEDSGLKGEYVRLEPKETTLRHCGTCGGDLQVIPGAKAVLCENCGTRVDVETDEVNCSNCAGLISFAVGAKRVNCPFCKTENVRMGW